MGLQREPGESIAAFAQRVREGKQPQSPEFDADLIPDLPPVEKSTEQYEIAAVLDRVDIVEAYRLWCGKMQPVVGNKRESIMVSCPNPAHPDAHPSAWVTLDKGDGGVGHCEPCSLGFDKYDIAAWHYGFDVPGYKTNFPELRRRMAEGLGYRVMVQGKVEWLEKIQPDPEPSINPEPPPSILVVALNGPSFDWRNLPAIAPDTFLHEWLTITSELYEPEEFYLWEGLMALACAVGNHVSLDDEPVVRPNLMTCLIGSTGTGKSRSLGHFTRLIHTALPWDSATANGVRMLSSAGSGEAMLDQFVYSVTDASTKTVETFPVNGLYVEDEFEGLMARINKPASTFRPYLMRFYDAPAPVRTISRSYGEASAIGHFMQLISSTQPSRLGDLTSQGDASSGFLNRWFFVFGTEKYRPALSRVRLNIDRSVELLRHIRAWGSSERTVRFSDPATNAAWSDFVMARIRPIEASEDQLAARIELQCKKVLLLLAINDKMTTISTIHLDTLKMMFPYIIKCYGVVEKQVGKTDLQACVEAMLAYFLNHPDEAVTARVLGGSSGARRYEESVRKKAIETMLGTYIEELPQERKARTTRYRLITDEPALAVVTSL